MSNKVKRKVTVETHKNSGDQPRRPSVFERLGKGSASSIPSQSQNRSDQVEKCRDYLRQGFCKWENTCKFQHDPPIFERPKPEKNMDEKDLRHRVRTKRDTKESRTSSISPKRKSGKRSSSHSRKGDHESKIKSTVVVTRPRSPPALGAPTAPSSAPPHQEATESRKKPDGIWEDDSDDWPMDAAQLDYKEELTLERKRQQLQRELELELQKEQLMNENVTVTKTQVSFSESSSSSSSSESGSRSSSSDSSSSSSEEDSDASSSSSSSTSSSGSRAAATTKRRTKHNQQTTNKEQSRKRSSDAKSRESYDKVKSGRPSKSSTRGRSPSPTQHETRMGKKSRDRRGLLTPSPKRHGQQELKVSSAGKTVSKVRGRGPRTPSPPPPPSRNKQRQWGQSSSTDSRVELRRGRGKKHRRKRDLPRNDRLKPGQPPPPPPLSSPNRTALLPMPIVKKSKQRREERERNRRRGRLSSPLLLSPANAQQPKLLGYAQQYPASNLDKSSSKHGHSSDRSKHSRKESGEISSRTKQSEGRDKSSRRKSSPRKEPKGSASPHRFENDHLMGVARKVHTQASSHLEKETKGNRHRSPVSPPRTSDNSRERRNKNEPEKRRDPVTPPRDYAMHRDGPFHGGDVFEKGAKAKRGSSQEGKKGREDRNRDRSQKDRVSDYDSSGAWNEDHRKSIGVPGGRRTPEPHGRVEMRAQQQGVPPRGERSREKDPDRKKRKDRDVSLRSSMEDLERPARMPSPRRGSQSPLHTHPSQREIESLTGTRNRMYESDLPPPEHEYAYGYETLHDPYMDRLLPPEYEQDVLRGPPLYPPDVYADSRYRRDPSLKDGAPPMMDRYGGRDGLSPRDMIPHRDVIGMPGRNDDYISDLSMDERRSFDERWSRTRVGSRADEWDPYGAILPAPLPPHVTAAPDEDRYGMPRRRRASPPDWPRNRAEERDIPPPVPAVHRPGRGSLPAKEGRSRSPTKGPGANRGSWNERGNRQEANRNSDNRHDDAQKNQEDRKSRNAKKDRGKRKDEPAADKPKEKHGGTKRPHSSSPAPTKDAKRRKEDVQVPDGTATTEKATASTKRNRDDARSETKSSSRSQKSTKLDGASPTSDLSHSSRVSGQEKSDATQKISVETKTKVDSKDDKKARRNNDSKAIADDDFSDWSDDADELLNRDDFAESEVTTENLKSRNDKSKEDAGSSKQKENQRPPAKDFVQDLKNKVKERGSSSRTSSKERTHDVSSHSSKEKDKNSVEVKDIVMQETYLLKDENATDVEEYITAESVDYDPISDEELDALIEEPDDSLLKPSQDKEKSKIVDALDINWSTLMAEKKTEFLPGFARQRFKAAHILSRIGFSQVFAGAELSEKLVGYCQKQLDEENRQKGEGEVEGSVPGENVFAMEHSIASFHVAISQNKVERKNAFNKIGPFRRALSARRDLQIRKLLCKPVNKLTACAPVVYSPQYSVVDKDLYKQSLELLRQKKAEMLPPAVDVC